ncbi:hypothetical protein HDU96_008934 [Phlyctochytrium bullatum]|nr:hypothetical protein HDU96_008934 [Phlyctochytrium bullatum]
MVADFFGREGRGWEPRPSFRDKTMRKKKAVAASADDVGVRPVSPVADDTLRRSLDGRPASNGRRSSFSATSPAAGLASLAFRNPPSPTGGPPPSVVHSATIATAQPVSVLEQHQLYALRDHALKKQRHREQMAARAATRTSTAGAGSVVGDEARARGGENGSVGRKWGLSLGGWFGGDDNKQGRAN